MRKTSLNSLLMVRILVSFEFALFLVSVLNENKCLKVNLLSCRKTEKNIQKKNEIRVIYPAHKCEI
jgi:hypothetical protein